MISEMLEGRHGKFGPLAIFGYINQSGAIFFLAFDRGGTFRKVPMEECSADWHYDEVEGFVPDTKRDV